MQLFDSLCTQATTALARLVTYGVQPGSDALLRLYIGITPDTDHAGEEEPVPIVTLHWCSSRILEIERRDSGQLSYMKAPRVYFDGRFPQVLTPSFVLARMRVRTSDREIVFSEAHGLIAVPVPEPSEEEIIRCADWAEANAIVRLRAPWRFSGGPERIASSLGFPDVEHWIREHGAPLRN